MGRARMNETCSTWRPLEHATVLPSATVKAQSRLSCVISGSESCAGGAIGDFGPCAAFSNDRSQNINLIPLLAQVLVNQFLLKAGCNRSTDTARSTASAPRKHRQGNVGLRTIGRGGIHLRRAHLVKLLLVVITTVPG
jgi:hypothetical protein